MLKYIMVNLEIQVYTTIPETGGYKEHTWYLM